MIGVLAWLTTSLGAGEEGVQYNTARTLRHLALGSQPQHKQAALPAVVPLTQALQVLHLLCNVNSFHQQQRMDSHFPASHKQHLPTSKLSCLAWFLIQTSFLVQSLNYNMPAWVFLLFL